MSQGNYSWVPCTIENAGFSSERRFEVDLPANGGRIVGAAYIEHFRDGAKNPLHDGQPPYGTKLQGFVKCRILRREGDGVLIEFPGTDHFHVPSQALEEGCWTKR
jgi:hypothetical protein